jgi:hypothetical protein
MEELHTSNNPPEFGSLSEIMERFHSVPYDLFQQELQNWFERGIAKQKGLTETKELRASPNFMQLFEVIGKIYHQAEVSQTLSDAQIPTTDESK